MTQQSSQEGMLANAEAQVTQMTAQVTELKGLLAQQDASMQMALSAQPPRMHPTLGRMKLPSDTEDWSLRKKRAPSFKELYQQLYFTEYTEESSVFKTFPN